MRIKFGRSHLALVALAALLPSTLPARADEARQVFASVRLPVGVNQTTTRGGASADTTRRVPSDYEVMRMASKSGARLTRDGIVQPRNKLRGNVSSPIMNNAPLTEEEKMLEVGKPEAPSSTRGQTAYGYIFIKPQNVAGLGHIGWGYWAPNVNYYVCGSTENPATSKPQSSVYIAPGWDNGYWSQAYYSEREMFNKFKQMGYYAYKRKMVAYPNPDVAWARANYTRNNGFIGIGWNCLDQTYYILEGYGVRDMPWKQTNPAPNGWFNAFPTTGYALP